MLIPQFEAREHGLFGGHESEDIRTTGGPQDMGILLMRIHFT